MTPLVVDASVAIKWHVLHDDTELAFKLARQGYSLVAPQLIVAEFCNAIWQIHRHEKIDHQQADEALDVLNRFIDQYYSDSSIAEKAMQFAIELDHPAYDCFYLALAEKLETRVVTSDRRLIGKCRETTYSAFVVSLNHLN